MNDCTEEVTRHQRAVARVMSDFIIEILERAQAHDASKLSEIEKPVYDKWTPRICGETEHFGNEDYEYIRAQMAPALEHHYAENRHHPEHFEDGVNDMTLIDLLEMVADWIAIANGEKIKLEYLAKRFKIGAQLLSILKNTIGDAEEKA